MPNTNLFPSLKSLLLPAIMITGLSACGGSDDSGDGYITLYNASANSPAIFLTLDEDLDEDGTDYFEQTFSSVGYGQSSGDNLVASNTYFLELAWQNDDSFARDDLAMIHESQISVSDDDITFVVFAEDVIDPKIFTYNIPMIDDEDDKNDDLFNMRFLNMHPTIESLDIYLSRSDETFNEAVLLGQYKYSELADNVKFDQDDYTFYITLADSKEVVFKSDEISYSFASQYVMVIRENLGVGSSPFVLDKVSGASAVEYVNNGEQARFKVFNGIEKHELFEGYDGSFDVYINGVEHSPQFEDLNIGEFSEAIVTDRGDYSIELTLPDTQEFIIKNHLMTLSENVDRTIFFYLKEDDVDHDGDGDVDEDGDGLVDEIEITVNSLIVDNSVSRSVYDHGVKIINLVDDDDFTAVNFSFVRSDEIIDTATNKKTASFGDTASITLLNNTYTIYAVAKIHASEILLIQQELVLNEDSEEQFLLLEADVNAPSGYKITLSNQAD